MKLYLADWSCLRDSSGHWEVLDYHSTRCQSDEQFEEWKIEHVASNQCDINFTGNSPAMEAEEATVL